MVVVLLVVAAVAFGRGGEPKEKYTSRNEEGVKKKEQKGGSGWDLKTKKNPEKQIRGVKVMRISDNSRLTLEAASRRRLQSRLVLAAFEASAVRFCLNEPPRPH